MNEQELMKVIRETAENARNHHCTGRRPYAGTPPANYLGKAAAFLKTRGYRLIRTDHLDQHEEGRTRGEAIGGITDRPHYRHCVLLAKGMHPAEEFTVLCHELAHVILGHPCSTPEQYMRQLHERAPYLRRGLTENPKQEMSCELASAAVTKVLGLPLTGEHECYLYQRMGQYQYPVTSEVIWAAHLAARTILEVFS
jgi:hypothetical protein